MSLYIVKARSLINTYNKHNYKYIIIKINKYLIKNITQH